jgi:HK97 family phage portal protein
MALIRSAFNSARNASQKIFGQGFANRLFGPAMMTDAQGKIQPVIYGGPAVYPDVNALNFVQKGYSANGTVFTIVSMAARKFGSLPRYVYQIDDRKAERQMKAMLRQGKFTLKQWQDLEKKAYDEQVVDNAFADLLARPNEAMGQDFFFALSCVFYEICGENFIWLNRGDIDGMTDEQADKIPPVEMFILPPQYVDLIPDPEDVWGVVGYYLRVNGQRVFIRKSDMIHWRQPNPNFDSITRTHLRGFAPLNAGNKLVTQDDSATDAAVAMQQNDGAKGVLFNKTFDDLDPVQKSQIENVIGRKINNRDIKGSVATLQGEWNYLDLGATSVDMELVKSQESIFIRICNLFGINPMMFLANATYENIQQARKDLVTNLLLPMACSLRDEMNRVLLPAFGLDPKQYTHDVDVSQLPELQNDMALLVQSLSGAWWLTPNERRKAMNEEEDPNPLMDEIWMPTGMQMIDDAAMADTLNSFSDDPGSNQNDSGKPGSNLPPGRSKPGDKERLPAGAKA